MTFIISVSPDPALKPKGWRHIFSLQLALWRGFGPCPETEGMETACSCRQRPTHWSGPCSENEGRDILTSDFCPLSSGQDPALNRRDGDNTGHALLATSECPDPALKPKGWRPVGNGDNIVSNWSGPCPETEGMETSNGNPMLEPIPGPDPALKPKGWRLFGMCQ